jgi:hypothetical protein
MIKMNSIEDRALSEHTGSALLSKKSNGKYSIFLPVEETGENGSTPQQLDKTAIGNRQSTSVEGRQENPQKNLPFFLHRDNINAIEAVEGQVIDFLRLLPDFTGFKFSGTVTKMANSTGLNALEQGQLTITPTTKDVYVENCYPLVEDTVVFTSGIDEVIYLTAATGTNHTKVYDLTTDPADATITSTSGSTATATAEMGTGTTAHQLTITGAAAGSTIVTLSAAKSNYATFKRTILVIVE